MIDFEKLLAEVVSEDANTIPPEGIEMRIARALSAKTESAVIWRRIWPDAAAAAILIGLAWTLLHKHPRSAETAAKPAAQLSLIESASVQMPVAIKPPAARSPQPKRQVPAPGSARGSQMSMQNGRIGLTPLAVESLAVPSIEIAALTSNNTTEKEDFR